jgi:hypothetical protein
MKAKLVLLAAVLAGAMRAPAAEEQVALRDLPPAVQAAVRNAGMLEPRKIVRSTRDGVTTYDIEFERNNAPNPHLRVGADGKVIERLPLAPASETVWPAAGQYPNLSALLQSPMKLSDLPAAVQRTVAAHARGREVADIDRERWQGAQVYEVEFKDSGLNPQIHVAEDGTLVQDENDKPALNSLFRGIQLEDTPRPVQDSVKRVAGDRPIVDIDRRGPLNRSVYVVEIRTTTGLETLYLAEDGNVLESSGQGVSPARK